MGIISDFKASKDMKKLQNGEKVYLSLSQIVNFIIYLPDAYKNLDTKEYNEVMNLYDEYRKCNTPILMNSIKDYYRTCIEVIETFNKIAPFGYYSGLSPIEMFHLTNEIQQFKEYENKTKKDLSDFKYMVTCTSKFKENNKHPKELRFIPNENETFIISKERLDFLLDNNYIESTYYEIDEEKEMQLKKKLLNNNKLSESQKDSFLKDINSYTYNTLKSSINMILMNDCDTTKENKDSKTQFCTNCGNKIESNWKFCKYCGKETE